MFGTIFPFWKVLIFLIVLTLSHVNCRAYVYIFSIFSPNLCYKFMNLKSNDFKVTLSFIVYESTRHITGALEWKQEHGRVGCGWKQKSYELLNNMTLLIPLFYLQSLGIWHVWWIKWEISEVMLRMEFWISESVGYSQLLASLGKIRQNQSFFHIAFASDRPEVSDFLQNENLYSF